MEIQYVHSFNSGSVIRLDRYSQVVLLGVVSGITGLVLAHHIPWLNSDQKSGYVLGLPHLVNRFKGVYYYLGLARNAIIDITEQLVISL